MSFIERETFITVPAGLHKHNKGFGMDYGKCITFSERFSRCAAFLTGRAAVVTYLRAYTAYR
jgi:hypothetical protein